MTQKTGQTNEDRTAASGPEQAAAPQAPEAAEPEAPDLEAQIADLKDRLLRTMADAENSRRRAERDVAEAHKFAIARFARDLLSVADNLRRAIETVPAAERDGPDEVTRNLIAGVEMVERELMSTFENHGIKQVTPEPGTKFDPNLHQAMAQVPGSGQTPGTVVDTYQTGYMIEDRLLRAAMVTVAAAETQADKTEGAKQPAAKSAKELDAEQAVPPEPGADPDAAAETEA